MKNFTITGYSLEDALKDALDKGFTTIETEAGLHTPITQFISEMDSDTYSRDDFALFGRFIVSLTDAWDWNAEIYALE